MHLFACDGCFVGLPAVISLVIAAVVLIGSIYMLLWSNLGARQAYLVMMVSLSGWMIILSALWLFGAPGTTPGTGPRAREPAWVPFTADSQVAKESFATDVGSFPGDGWESVDPKNPKIYPGNISAIGEEISVFAKIEASEAALAEKQGLSSTKPTDWTFRDTSIPSTIPNDPAAPAVVKFKQEGTHLLFGAIIPATAKHPEVKVFAYRDKGIVFLYALEFLLVFGLLFVIHLMLLARYETAQRKREEEQTEQREPALV
jgi:hypothetical protein